MNVVLAADRGWKCPALVERIIGRLVNRYGKGLRLAISDNTAVAQQVLDLAGGKHKVPVTTHPTDEEALGGLAAAVRNKGMVDDAGCVVIMHRSIKWSKHCRNLARQSVASGVPTFLIETMDGEPVRLHADDPRLAI